MRYAIYFFLVFILLGCLSQPVQEKSGYVCPDGREVKNPSECVPVSVYTCPNGVVVSDPSKCPKEIYTCPTGERVADLSLCPPRCREKGYRCDTDLDCCEPLRCMQGYCELIEVRKPSANQTANKTIDVVEDMKERIALAFANYSLKVSDEWGQADEGSPLLVGVDLRGTRYARYFAEVFNRSNKVGEVHLIIYRENAPSIQKVEENHRVYSPSISTDVGYAKIGNKTALIVIKHFSAPLGRRLYTRTTDVLFGNLRVVYITEKSGETPTQYVQPLDVYLASAC
ncbi:MAG: hypothetical protein QXP42_00285 [Candidatus Micrarchaeia archaeon]